MPRHVPVTQPRPLEATRVAAPVAVDAVRRFRSAATQVPARGVPVERQLRHRSSPTPAAARAAAADARSRASRRDATRDPGSQFIYLRDVRDRRRLVGDGAALRRGAAGLPRDAGARARDVPPRRRRHRDEPGHRRLDRRRRRSAAAGDHEPQRSRCARSTSRATPRSCWSTPAADLAHPAFGKLFVETEYRADWSALLCRRRPGGFDADEVWAVHVLSLEGRPQGALECETDRSRFLGRGRGPDDPQALDGRSLSNTRRRDARSHCQPAAASPARAGRIRAAVVRHRHGVESRNRARAGAEVPRAERVGPDLRAGRHARAEHCSGTSAFRATTRCVYERLASRVLYLDGSLRASPDVQRAKHARAGGAVGAQHLRRSPDRARPRRRGGCAAADPADPRSAGILAAEGAERRHRHPQRAPGRATSTKRTSRSRRCSTTVRGGRGRIVRAASICCAPTTCRRRERTLLIARRARRPAWRSRHARQPARSAASCADEASRAADRRYAASRGRRVARAREPCGRSRRRR